MFFSIVICSKKAVVGKSIPTTAFSKTIILFVYYMPKINSEENKPNAIYNVTMMAVIIRIAYLFTPPFLAISVVKSTVPTVYLLVCFVLAT